jgi:uncharacterized membrane protein YhfC
VIAYVLIYVACLLLPTYVCYTHTFTVTGIASTSGKASLTQHQQQLIQSMSKWQWISTFCKAQDAQLRLVASRIASAPRSAKALVSSHCLSTTLHALSKFRCNTHTCMLC